MAKSLKAIALLVILLAPTRSDGHWLWGSRPVAAAACYPPPAPVYVAPPPVMCAPTWPPGPMPSSPNVPPWPPGPVPSSPNVPRSRTAEPPYATPTPAPPSASSAEANARPIEPALNSRPELTEPGSKNQPAVSESHSFFDTYIAVPGRSDKPRPDRCMVGFWNLSKQPLTLKLGGETRTLAPGGNVRLELAREFVWQIGNHEPQSEKVPAAEAGLNIVIRR